jgi:hypothetical protein
VSLTRRERRALRAIEAALADEDPALGDLLSAPLPSEVVITRIAWSLLATSMSLLVFGAVVSDAVTTTAAVLTLEISLAVLLIVAAGSETGPASRRDENRR